MSMFTVLENGIAVNQIVADSKELAEAATGQECVEAVAVIGYRFHPETNEFRPDCAFASWVWDSATQAWVAPKKKPKTGDYGWDEGSLSWVEIIAPVAYVPETPIVEEAPAE